VCKVFFLASPTETSPTFTRRSVKTLVHAFVTTRLDYCNSVLAYSVGCWLWVNMAQNKPLCRLLTTSEHGSEPATL